MFSLKVIMVRVLKVIMVRVLYIIELEFLQIFLFFWQISIVFVNAVENK